MFTASLVPLLIPLLLSQATTRQAPSAPASLAVAVPLVRSETRALSSPLVSPESSGFRDATRDALPSPALPDAEARAERREASASSSPASASSSEWIVGAGVGFIGLGGGTLGGSLGGGLGGLGLVLPPDVYRQGEVGPPLRLSTSVERRILGGPWWLLAQLAASTSSSTTSSKVPQFEAKTEYTRRESSWSTGFGARRIFNPGRAVEVSGFAMAGVAGSSASTEAASLRLAGGEIARQRSTTDGVSFGAHAGLAFEMPLLDSLSLRLASPLLALAWSRTSFRLSQSSVTEEEPPPEREGTGRGFRASFAFEPSLELRMSF